MLTGEQQLTGDLFVFEQQRLLIALRCRVAATLRAAVTRVVSPLEQTFEITLAHGAGATGAGAKVSGALIRDPPVHRLH